MALIAVLLMCLAASLLLSGLGYSSVRKVLARPVPEPTTLLPLSVLRPLKGLEVGLYENLVSLAVQDYPDFELVLGIADPDDPAVEVARQLKRDYPGVRVRLATGAPVVGLNPKVNNLLHMAARARHDLILVSDSNVRVGPTYLRQLAAELSDPSVGLVHSALVGQGDGSVGSVLENLQMNTVTAYGACGMLALSGRPLVIGKSMLFRKSELDQIGGLLGVANVLAEDYVIGRRFHAAGFAVRLSPHRIEVISAGWALDRFLNRQLRWSQMRFHLAPLAYLFEPLICSFFWAGVLATVASVEALPSGWRDGLLAVCAVVVSIRVALDSAQTLRLRGRRLSAGEVALLPVKDLLMLSLWVAGFLKRTINWRGTVAYVGAGSVLSAAPQRTARQRAAPHAG